MTRYEVIIYWSDEDEAFIAEVPELPGLVPLMVQPTRKRLATLM